MPDYSLMPVDYHPDFSNVSLVPVDYDPFGYAENSDSPNLIGTSGFSSDGPAAFAPPASSISQPFGSQPFAPNNLDTTGVGAPAGTTVQVPFQLAAMSEEERERLGRPFVGETSEGGGGPPASSFSGSRTNPLQAPDGPPRNSPGEFNGQPFSGHVFDQLQNRGIPPSAVENVIKNGSPSAGNTPGTTRFYDPINDISVVRDDATGNIVTIRPGN